MIVLGQSKQNPNPSLTLTLTLVYHSGECGIPKDRCGAAAHKPAQIECGLTPAGLNPTCPVKKGTTKSRLRNFMGPTNLYGELLLF